MHLLDNPIRSETLLEKTFDIEHRFYASSSEPMSAAALIALARDNGDEDLIDLYHNHSLGYAENGGSLDVREAVATLYDERIGAEHVVIFPGAQTGMTLAALAMLHPGDHTIVITPSYQSMEDSAKYAGSTITRVALTPANLWQVKVSDIEAAITDSTKYLVFNDPHNPSGALMSAETKQEIVALCEQHGIRILSDEVYRLLELNADDRSASIAEMTPKGLALGTMAKPFGCGGAGIGWVVCQDLEVIQKLRRSQHMFAVCCSRAGEIQAMMALRVKDVILERNLAIIRENLALLAVFFKEYTHLFEWIPPQASGTGFVKFKGPFSAEVLAQALLKEGILVFPASIFDCDSSLEQYFRIGFSRRTMPAALEAFKRYVNTNSQAWQSVNHEIARVQ